MGDNGSQVTLGSYGMSGFTFRKGKGTATTERRARGPKCNAIVKHGKESYICTAAPDHGPVHVAHTSYGMVDVAWLRGRDWVEMKATDEQVIEWRALANGTGARWFEMPLRRELAAGAR